MKTQTEFATNGRVRLAYEVRGSGEPLLLIHGLGYARWGWEPVADRFAEEFATCLYDNRGIGESDAPPGPYTVEDLAADAVAVLDAVGFERAHVLGTSLGGMVAQQVALDHPERVEKLVLVCTTPGGSSAYAMPDVTVQLLSEMPFLPEEVALRRAVENALAPDTAASSPETIERIIEHRRATHQPRSAWLAQASAGAAFDVFARLGEIGRPTLVIHGTEDVVVDARNGDLLADRIGGARLERFPGTGHILYWEEPERFVEVVTGFLRSDG